MGAWTYAELWYMESGLLRYFWLQEILGQAAEPIRNRPRKAFVVHEGRGEEAFRHMDAELTVGLELFLVEELVEGALMRKIRVRDAVTLDQFGFVPGDR